MKPQKNLKDYARQTTIQLIAGGIILLFIVGDGLIYLIYGSRAAISGLLCLGAGLMPVAATLLVIGLLDWIVKHAREE